MANKPFFAVNTNVVDESECTTTASMIGTNSVLITQNQQRRMFDTLTTSVCGNPTTSFQIGGNFAQTQKYCSCMQQQQQQQPNGGVLQANAQLVPGGVVFTFRQPLQQLQMSNPFWPCFQQVEDNCLEKLLLHERWKQNPFTLQFHHDKKVATSDYTSAPSMSQPDFNAAAAFRASDFMRDCPMCCADGYGKAKQLRLPANHPDLQPHATHVTAGEEKQTMTDEKGDHDRHVTFKEEVIKNTTTQTVVEKGCDTTETKDDKNAKTNETRNDDNSDNKQEKDETCGCDIDSNEDKKENCVCNEEDGN